MWFSLKFVYSRRFSFCKFTCCKFSWFASRSSGKTQMIKRDDNSTRWVCVCQHASWMQYDAKMEKLIERIAASAGKYDR